MRASVSRQPRWAVLAYPLFLLLNSGNIAAAIAAHCDLAAIESVYISAAVVAGVELFATRVRYSGFSIGYNIAVVAFGGTTSHMVTWLTGNTGNNLPPAFYVIVAAVVSLVTVLTLRENACRPLPAVAFGRTCVCLTGLSQPYLQGVVSRRF